MKERHNRILLVDDEPQIRVMLRDILEQQGYVVATAKDCAQAMEEYRQFLPDAVLLDVMLPDGDGFTLCEQIRCSSDLPVLFLSARDEDEARLKGLGLGADDYITKPFLPKELLLRLAAVMRRVYREEQKQELCLGNRRNRFLGRKYGTADRKGVYPPAKAVGKSRKYCNGGRALFFFVGRGVDWI